MKKGFTLVELLACLLVMAVMLLMIIPSISDTVKERKESNFFNSAKGILRQVEYLNINNLDDEIYAIEDLDLPGISSDGYDLASSFIKIEDGEITMNLVGNNSFEGMYLCGITTSTKLNEGDVTVTYTACTPFLTENYIDLTLNLDGGVTTQKIRDEYLVGTTIYLTEPTKNSSIFTGWQLTSGNSVLDDNKLLIGSTDTVLTAIYVNGYALTIDLDGGNVKTEYDSMYKLNDKVVLEKPIKTGYIFSEWEITSGTSTLSDGNIITIQSDTVVKAIYEQD